MNRVTSPTPTVLPATAAADAHEARALGRGELRRRLLQHLLRASIAGAIVVVGLAAVSVYLAEVGRRTCETDVDTATEVCVDFAYWPFTIQVRSETWTENGVAHGPRLEWHSNGAPWVRGEYDHGSRTGVWVEHWPSGAVRFAGRYKDDVLVGEESWFYADGSLEWTGNRHKGKRQGVERWYWENGNLRREGTWLAGEKDGLFTSYGEDGVALFVSRYKDGVLVTPPSAPDTR